ncbi:FAD binding domain-containing protein [Neobacillus niacini]|uniref:FAD binding domain-containing protein n=1 Tax=Neobacillus niacini TaxID=86668 RepID=UPI00052FA185|nr:FAD binding domain-containing protein [Neobacillus niacini]KGM46181.1 xanthine dehydrogenase [Neobacillus niacini]MEC1522275.1 FAD binding domain-containing protein [Neobacillus niacini]
MLSFDFDYYRPKTLQEAVGLFQNADRNGKKPMYISGATELLTLGRINLAFTEAAIDLKDIVEGNVMQFEQGYLVIGANLTLTKIEEANLFPLLTNTSSNIADHTARGKITLGGNICGQIFYREAVLPFLLADSQVVIVGPEGVTVKPLNEIFNEQLILKKGEFLIQVATDDRYIHAPFISIKRRQQWETGYPLITVAALKIDGEVRTAFSGLCPFPFRSKKMEAALNNHELSVKARIQSALAEVPSPILNDVEGSSEYRLFVLQNLLEDVLGAFD